MSKSKIIFTTGLAMFAMFFGSGNLVFPLQLGVESGDNYLISSIGFIITGVAMPFLGLFSVMLYKGDKNKYFGLLGKWEPFVLTTLLLLLMGPFGVAPRCIIVAYGGINALYPDLPLLWFSIFFSAIIILIIWEQNNIVPIVGKLLGPIKISTIIIIIIAGLIYAPELTNQSAQTAPFLDGIFEGYQTMDLPAAFFFSITIVQYLNRAVKNKDEVLGISLASGAVGATLIASIYFCFTTLGAHYSEVLRDVKPEQYLATIAHMTLGKNAALIFALTMFLACLTTAATLCRLFAEFLCHDISKDKISWRLGSLITVGVTFVLSLTGFSTIATILGTMLTYVYPALVVLAISSLFSKYAGFGYTRHAFWATIFIAIVSQHIL
jgi:LIVCS family branched-chain amino acid:cation transporter